MQYRQTQNQQMLLNMPLNLNFQIIDFLNTQQLAQLHLALVVNEDYKQLDKIITVKLIYAKYYDVFDRTYYLDVFNSQKYIAKQNRSYYQLALSQKYNQIRCFPNKFQGLLSRAAECVPKNLSSQFRQCLKNFIIDPAIAMPRLHRQTVGLSIKSNFQSMLLAIKQQECNDCDFMDQNLELLKQHIQQQQENMLRQMIQLGTDQKLKNIRYFAKEINYQNMDNFIISGNSLMNLMVYIFGLTDLYIEQIVNQLDKIQDSVQLMMVLTTRYMQFQNFIITIQENLGYVFRTFGELYSELNEAVSNEYSFYQPSINKWNSKLSKFHKIINPLFAKLTSVQISKKIDANSSFCSDDTQASYKQEIYEMLELQSTDIETLLSLYSQYIVNMSIDLSNVQLCGHSLQNFGTEYKSLQISILEYEILYSHNLKKINEKGFIQNDEVNQILKQRIYHYEGIIRMCTIRKMTKLYQNIYANYDRNIFNYTEKDLIIERANSISVKMQTNGKIHDAEFQMDEETAESSNSSLSMNQYESDNQDLVENEHTKLVASL